MVEEVVVAQLRVWVGCFVGFFRRMRRGCFSRSRANKNSIDVGSFSGYLYILAIAIINLGRWLLNCCLLCFRRGNPHR